MGIVFEDEKVRNNNNSSQLNSNSPLISHNNMKDIDEFTLKRVRRFAEYFADLA
jgi:hypothetical protein